MRRARSCRERILVSGRANLSSVKRYDVFDTSQFTLNTIKYNTAGAVVATIDSLGHQTGVSYADSFSDGNNSRNTFAYPTTVTDAGGFSSDLQYNYDFGARTQMQEPPPANQAQGLIRHLPTTAQLLALEQSEFR